MANDMIEASGAPPPGCQDILGKSLSENTPPAGSGGTMKSPCHGNEPNRPTGYRQIRKPAAITAVNTFRDRSASRTCTGTAGRTNGNEQPASVIHGSLQHKTRRYYRRRSKSPPHRVNSFVKPTQAWISIASKVSQSQFCTPIDNHRRGERAVVDHRPATRPPVRSGVAIELFGGLVAEEF